MKQELLTAKGKAASVLPKFSVSSSHAGASRAREVPRMEPANVAAVSLKSKLKPSQLYPSHIQRSGRTIPSANRTKTEEETGAPWNSEMERPEKQAVERRAQLRQRADASFRGSEDAVKLREMQQRLDISENLVDRLQSELALMIAQFEKLQGRNSLLDTQNKQLLQKLSAAEAKILALKRQNQQASRVEESHKSEFKDLRNRFGDKLDNPVSKKEATTEGRSSQKVPVLMQAIPTNPGLQPKIPAFHPPVAPPPPRRAPVGMPPPPPPLPPLPHAPAEANSVRKPTALVELYRSLTMENPTKGSLGSGSCASAVTNSIVGEIQNRSTHLLAIKADVETKGDFIRNLIEKVKNASYTDIEEVLKFVDWLDKELSTLADERAVLKHFNWPERKADALREAAFEFRDLKKLEIEASSFEDDISMVCDTSLKKIVALLEKSERAVERVTKLRETTMLSYRECKIPTDWMLDSGMVSRIKLACVKLAKVYIGRVSLELRLARHAEKESAQQALLLQGVRFAYRAYQFAGGLDSETMCAVEELRKGVQVQGRGAEGGGLLVS